MHAQRLMIGFCPTKTTLIPRKKIWKAWLGALVLASGKYVPISQMQGQENFLPVKQLLRHDRSSLGAAQAAPWRHNRM